MNAKGLIETLKHTRLTGVQPLECMSVLMNEGVPVEQKSALLSMMEARKPALTELNGFSEFILENCIVPFEYGDDLMDVCGTGGDGNNTINFSTLTAFVLAAAGIKICKHGNYGVTSVNGSSGILEYFGYRFKTTAEELERELETFNVTFLHAPLFHPVLKNMAAMRKNLQMKTIFNVLGPLVNPLQPKYRFTGVSNLQVARNYHFLYGQKNYCYAVVHTLDGNDELTLTDAVKIYSHSGERLIHPADLSAVNVELEDLRVHSMADAAKKFMRVLRYEAPEPVMEALLCNAAMAYTVRHETVDFATAKAICREALQSGKVKLLFDQILNCKA
ncbi:MAG TPA: anthranilate phosphoribosyltransferase [Flavobacteriales bacterium]|nr:anthranilate phosphoribosyltransferase [Flavobacteriales bacterium]